jgi:hypothetical protein
MTNGVDAFSLDEKKSSDLTFSSFVFITISFVPTLITPNARLCAFPPFALGRLFAVYSTTLANGHLADSTFHRLLASHRLCPLLNGTMKPEDAGLNGDSSFGAVPAPLTL